VPALCTNSDLHRICPGGRILPGAGALAAHCDDLGGPVRQIDKPYADIYRAALALVPDWRGGGYCASATGRRTTLPARGGWVWRVALSKPVSARRRTSQVRRPIW